MKGWSPFGKVDTEIGSFLAASVFNKEHMHDSIVNKDNLSDNNLHGKVNYWNIVLKVSLGSLDNHIYYSQTCFLIFILEIKIWLINVTSGKIKEISIANLIVAPEAEVLYIFIINLEMLQFEVYSVITPVT